VLRRAARKGVAMRPIWLHPLRPRRKNDRGNAATPVAAKKAKKRKH